MLFISIIFAALCFAANLKRKRDDSSDDLENGPSPKLQKTTDANDQIGHMPSDVWQIVMSFENFESAPELALVDTTLNTCVPKAVYEFLVEKCKSDEFLTEDSILRLLPLFLKHVDTIKHDTDFSSIFLFLFRHAKSHNYASKIYKAWKSLGLILTHDRALIDALQDSVGFPVENPIPMFFHRRLNMYKNFRYSYVYPTILLKFRSISAAVWTDLFHALLNSVYGKNNQRHPSGKAYIEGLKTFINEVWSEMGRAQQDDSLELISRTILFYTGKSGSDDFVSISEVTQKLVGRCLPKITCNDFADELQLMDESTFHEILMLGPLICLHEPGKMLRFWVRKAVRVREMFVSLCAAQTALVQGNVLSLSDYKLWGATELITMAGLTAGKSVSNSSRLRIARSVWEARDLDGMIIFSLFITKQIHLLKQSLQDFLDASSSVFECITGNHLRFISIMKIAGLQEIINERVTAEHLLIAESYKPGQDQSPFDAKMVDPDVASLIVKCIRDDHRLSTKLSIYAILQSLPSLKRFYQ